MKGRPVFFMGMPHGALVFALRRHDFMGAAQFQIWQGSELVEGALL